MQLEMKPEAPGTDTKMKTKQKYFHHPKFSRSLLEVAKTHVHHLRHISLAYGHETTPSSNMLGLLVLQPPDLQPMTFFEQCLRSRWARLKVCQDESQ
jgi:hypothetical protein